MLDRLTEALRPKNAESEGPLADDLQALLGDAPAEVVALARELAREHARLPLGWHAIEHRYLGSLAETWQQVADDLGVDDPRAHELAHGLQIGASAGGEVYFGLVWGGPELRVAEVDFEEGILTWHDSVQRFLEAIAAREPAVPPVVAQLLGIVTPEPTRPPDQVVPWGGTSPEHPFAEAFRYFQVSSQAFVSARTPAGRRVLVRRFSAGTPYVPATVVCEEPDGTTHVLEWTDTTDISGLCTVPGHERVLLVAGFSGPLIELDLATGARRELRPTVGWSCGFVDDDHLVVYEDREARVYRYDPATEPTWVSATPIEGFNLFVGHGRVYTVVGGGEARLLELKPEQGVLVEASRAPIAPRPFALHAAAERDGRRLLAFVDTKGACVWFDAGAV